MSISPLALLKQCSAQQNIQLSNLLNPVKDKSSHEMYQRSGKNFKEAMRNTMLKFAQEDTLVALDFVEKRLKIKILDKGLENLDKLNSGRVISDPEVGLLYRDARKINKFLIMD
ncbi:hypothetical protein L1987_45629 [Smallanthus sonchifolius]|uniref:Uncharacterized protein n=1 Tax=Smallanthus sonchifolius TaxID=185202 RepID=A0ACB9FY47_9ASTR|nr:hypothetical protein L1987_45629 [Smallanthus sonchifolius]